MFVATAQADVLVTVGNLDLPVGSTSGLLPVYISSNAADQVGTTSFEFVITRGAGTNTFLAFNPAVDPSSTTFNSVSPPYVFAGNSFDQSVPLALLSNITTTSYPNDTAFGGDSTNNGANVTLSSVSNGTLLALLPLTTATGAPPAVGDTFQVSLVPTSDPTGTSNPNTGFSFNGEGQTFYAFSSTVGTITIVSAAVPEPASWILGLCRLSPWPPSAQPGSGSGPGGRIRPARSNACPAKIHLADDPRRT